MEAEADAFAELAVEPEALSLESLEQAVRASGSTAAADTATAARRMWRVFMMFSWVGPGNRVIT